MSSTAEEIARGVEGTADILKCPVCAVIYENRIFQCKNGHSICEKCKNQLADCPQCREGFLGTRNYDLEQMVKLILKPSTSKVKEESTEKIYGPDNLRHNLFIGPKQGKGNFRCRISKCNDNLPICRLLNHCRTFHHNVLKEVPKEECKPSYVHQFSLALNSHSSVYQVPKFGLFYFIVYIKKCSTTASIIHAWLQIAAPVGYSKNVRYCLEIKYKKSKAVFIDIPYIVKEKPEDIIEKGKCLKMETNSEKGKMYITLKIKENHESRSHVGETVTTSLKKRR